MAARPPQEVIDAIEAGTTSITRRIEFYEADGATPWLPSSETNQQSRLIDGSISLDSSRDERRSIDITLNNADNLLRPNPTTGLWYDKIIKVFRGVRYPMVRNPPKVLIIEASSQAVGFGFRQTLLRIGFTNVDVDINVATLEDLTDYPIIISYMPNGYTLKSALLISAWRLGKHVISVGNLNTETEIPLISTTTSPGGNPTYGITPMPGDTELTGDWTTEAEPGNTGGKLVTNTDPSAIRVAKYVNGTTTHYTGIIQTHTVSGGKWFHYQPWKFVGPQSLILLRKALDWMWSWEPYRDREFQLGEFMIDSISGANFPHQLSVSGRDYTKKCLNSKIEQAESFPQDTSVRELFVALAANSGIVKMRVPLFDESINTELSFDSGTARWEIMKGALDSAGYQGYFDNEGFLTAELYADPAFGAVDARFRTGTKGNLVSFSRSLSDARVYNHVIVQGDVANDDTGLTPFGEAKNTEPSSPTNIARIGDRPLFITNSFYTSDDQCYRAALRMLKINALEQFEMEYSSFNYPWLEVGKVIEIIDPERTADDPVRFLHDGLTLALGLGPASGTAKRVTFITDGTEALDGSQTEQQGAGGGGYIGPPAPDAMYLFDDGTDGSAIVAGNYETTAVSGTPIKAYWYAVHGNMGYSGGQLSWQPPTPTAYTYSVYGYRQGPIGGTEDIWYMNEIGGGRSFHIRQHQGGLVDVLGPTNNVIDPGALILPNLSNWRMDISVRWDGDPTAVGSTANLSLVVGIYILNNVEGTRADQTMVLSFPTVKPSKVSLSQAPNDCRFDSIRRWNSVLVPPPYGDALTFPPLIKDTSIETGDITQTTVEVAVFSGTAGDQDLIGLNMSTSAAMTSPTSYTAAKHDEGGWNKWHITGLTTFTQYYFQATKTGVAYGSVAAVKTAPGATAAVSYKVAAWGCKATAPSSPAIFDDIRNLFNPLFCVDLGDDGYAHDLTIDLRTHKKNWAIQHTDAARKNLQLVSPISKVRSDHDTNDNGQDQNPSNYQDPTTAANTLAWSQVVPALMTDTRNPKVDIYRTITIGKVKHIWVDTRTVDRTNTRETGIAPDDPLSTMLGANQKARLYADLDSAGAAGLLVCMWTDPSWLGTSAYSAPLGIPSASSDKWGAYTFERDEISAHAFTALGGNFMVVASDSHMLQRGFDSNGHAAFVAGPADQKLHAFYQGSYTVNYPGGTKHWVSQMYYRFTFDSAVVAGKVRLTAVMRDCSTRLTDTPKTVDTYTHDYTVTA